MTTKTAGENEVAALRSVERAARVVLRYPDDKKPRTTLSNALRRLDRARKDDA